MRFTLKLLMLNFFFSCQLFALSSTDKSNFWQCESQDNSDKAWIAKSAYKKTAINLAFDLCKKNSLKPQTCSTSLASCEEFHHGISLRPLWSCTALDAAAQPWPSNLYFQQDDAALAAKDYCKQKSALPETCYIAMITCSNHLEGIKK